MTAKPSLLLRLGGWWIILAVPILLVMLNVRLVMSPVFLTIEYNRPGFPVDYYGMTTEQRLALAPSAVNYLVYGQPIAALADLRFDDGSPVFNARELGHMRDVQSVTGWAYGAGLLLAGVTVVIAVLVWRRSPERVYRALRAGAVLTLAVLVAIVVGAVGAWDVFFTGFHNLFFSSGTWVFAYSDSLIRLFPEQFWFDAAVTIGALAAAQAVIIWALAHWRLRRRGR